MPRIILAAGGTGGHIFPALAVAECLRREGAELLFVGSRYGAEAALAQQAGLAFRGLPVRGVIGRGFRAIGAVCALVGSMVPALALIRSFRPDAVIGFGAYASFVPLAAGWLSRVPVAIHEQNAMPGVTNRLLSRIARRIFLSMPDTLGVFPPARSVVTGNPVRQAIADLGSADRDSASPASDRHQNESGDPPRSPGLLVMGGSQGAKAINSAILTSLGRLLPAGVSIRHQTGASDYERVRAGYQAYGYDVSGVSPFIDAIADAYAWADLVVCRAGATSIAELAAAGKPSVLIPFPYATHDHQTLNAKLLSEAGAAVLVHERDMAGRDMGVLLLNLLENTEHLRDMSQKAHALARPDAAMRVASGVLELCRRRTNAN